MDKQGQEGKMDILRERKGRNARVERMNLDCYIQPEHLGREIRKSGI